MQRALNQADCIISRHNSNSQKSIAVSNVFYRSSYFYPEIDYECGVKCDCYQSQISLNQPKL